MTRAAAATLAVLVAALALVACGGDDDEPSPTSTPGPAATETPAAGRTGIDAVDAAIAAAEAGDVDALASMMRFTDVPCLGPTTIPQAAVEIIRCAPDQANGTLVGGFLYASCEGTSMIAAGRATPMFIAELRQAHDEVYAVYRTTPQSAFGTGDFPRVDYAVMLTYELEGRDAGLALLVGDDSIVGIDNDCGYPPDRMAELHHFGEVILGPAATRTGIPEVDAVIDALLTQDAATLRSLVQLRPVECIAPGPAELGALFCEEGETPGTAIDVLPAASCENHYTRAGELDVLLQFSPSTRLYAVYRAGEEYRVVVSQQAVEDGPLFGVTVGVEAGRITYVDFGCGQTPAQIVQNVEESGFLIAPSTGR